MIWSPSSYCRIYILNLIFTDLPGDINTIRYTYKELARATENFNPSNKIGEGGFGSVYKVVCVTFN